MKGNQSVKLLFLLIVILVVGSEDSWSQIQENIVITGVVLDADSLNPVPYTAIAIKNTNRGTISDNSGYFSIMVAPLDTLIFSVVGYKESLFVLPQLVDKEYSLIQLITRKTIVLSEVEILAWPDEKSFVNAFINLKLPKGQEDEIFRANNELAKLLNDQYENDKFYYEQMHYSKLYNTTGFAPPNNFLNPLRWSNFIKDWKNGEFKSKK